VSEITTVLVLVVLCGIAFLLHRGDRRFKEGRREERRRGRRGRVVQVFKANRDPQVAE
jgi:hypothetical protein